MNSPNTVCSGKVRHWRRVSLPCAHSTGMKLNTVYRLFVKIKFQRTGILNINNVCIVQSLFLNLKNGTFDFFFFNLMLIKISHMMFNDNDG